MTTYRKFWQDLPRMNFIEFVNDFLATSDYTAGDWTITALQGTNTIAVNTGAHGGTLDLVTGATENDGSGYNYKIEAFKPAIGKALEFEARFKINDVTQSDFIIGLQITDTTPFAVSNGIYFQSDDGDALLDFHAVKATVDSATAGIATLVDATYIKVGFYYDGVGDTIQIFVDDVRVGAVNAATYLPTAEELCISLAFTTGEAVAQTLSLDYIRVIAER